MKTPTAPSSLTCARLGTRTPRRKLRPDHPAHAPNETPRHHRGVITSSPAAGRRSYACDVLRGTRTDARREASSCVMRTAATCAQLPFPPSLRLRTLSNASDMVAETVLVATADATRNAFSAGRSR
jgi:hypothetical protein